MRSVFARSNESGQSALVDFRVIGRVLIQDWRGMLTLASAGVILASLWFFVQPREYTAQSSAIVFAGSSPNVGEGQAQMAFTRAKATQYQTLAQSPPVVDEAYKLSGLKPEGSITVAVPLDTPEIRFRVVRHDPVEVAKLANAFIDSLASAVKKIENGTVDGSGVRHGVRPSPVAGHRHPRRDGRRVDGLGCRRRPRWPRSPGSALVGDVLRRHRQYRRVGDHDPAGRGAGRRVRDARRRDGRRHLVRRLARSLFRSPSAVSTVCAATTSPNFADLPRSSPPASAERKGSRWISIPPPRPGSTRPARFARSRRLPPRIASCAPASPAPPRWRCRSRHTASDSRSSDTPSSRSRAVRCAPAG